MSQYNLLRSTFERSGILYKLLERDGMIAIYEAYKPNRTDVLYGYVVARITHEKEARFKNGYVIPARERFPSPSKFGIYGDFFMPKAESIAHARYKEWVDKFSTPYPPKKPVEPSGGKIIPFEDDNEESGGDGVVV
jgi:hypothetical protein